MYTNESDICSVAVNVDDFKRSDERSFYKWEKVNGKVVKSSVILSHHDLVDTFNAEVKILKKHIFIKRNQNAFYNYLKENLGDNEVLLQVDYSENYSNKDQQEIQSAYFGHNTFSIFTACAYYRTTDGIVGNKNITVTSNATDHSRIASHTCTMKVIEELGKTVQIKKLNVWSDGCAAQFRSRFVFDLISRIDRKYEIAWFYNERHHGKGPMDGVGGTLKNKVFRDVKSGKIQITSAESFANYAEATIDGIKSLYLPEDEVFDEPSDIEDAPKIPGTLEVHKVTRDYNEDGVCNLNFFKMASDEKPFFRQWYRRPGDPEVCDHPVLPLKYDIDNTCASCKESYLAKKDWLKCEVCEQWFHERCFMIICRRYYVLLLNMLY